MIKVVYTDQDTHESVLVCRLPASHSMSVWDALDACGVDMDEFARSQGWDDWDAEALHMVISN